MVRMSWPKRGAGGLNLKRVIITSAHPAERLHEVFDDSGCLAVIEKEEPEQQAAFMMILDSIMRRPPIDHSPMTATADVVHSRRVSQSIRSCTREQV